jgi:long-chain fatty acid transport protein
VGLSLTLPAGLSKKWSQPYPKTFAEEFTLELYEFAASAAYKVNDFLSLAGGLRGIYSKASVKSNGTISGDYGGVQASRAMDGDTTEFGYNLAATVRPTQNSNFSVTYRSKVDLGLKGDADLRTSANFAGATTYQGSGAVTVPLPAVLALAGSYTFGEQLTVELEYDRTYWSAYEMLDFEYPTSLGNPFLIAAFDSPKAKNWKDTNCWRLGVEYDLKNGFVLMAGFALDENPIPDSTLGFDLPDSDARLYSMGLRYQANDQVEVGIAYLYDDKESRNATNNGVSGTFDNTAAHLVAVGFSYKL